MRATGPLTARDVELAVSGATKALAAELARLRSDLAEARADVQRFEASLDAANRELAQVRAERDDHTKWCMDVLGAQSCSRHTAVTLQEYVQAEIAVGCAQCASEELTRLRAELAQAWADVSLYHHANQLHIRRRHRSRRTIRALVVTCRAMWYANEWGGYQRVILVQCMKEIRKAEQSGQQAGE